MEKLTLEILQDAIKEYFKGKDDIKSVFPQHVTGINEDGIRFSYWDYGGLITGDGGHEIICNKIKEQFNKTNG